MAGGLGSRGILNAQPRSPGRLQRQSGVPSEHNSPALVTLRTGEHTVFGWVGNKTMEGDLSNDKKTLSAEISSVRGYFNMM